MTPEKKDVWTLPGLRSVEPRAWQMAALRAWTELDGVLVCAGVGSGKSLVGAALAATGSNSLVLLPASVSRQTEAMYQAYGAAGVTFRSYTKMQRAESATFLEDLRPDVLVLDEAHLLRRIDTNSAAKRIERYLIAHPAVRVAVLTASLQSRDIMDWGHLANWALRAASPVPRLRAGRQALAERMARDGAAREAFRARLAACPGVVGGSTDADYPGETVVHVLRQAPLAQLPATWELPDGYLLESAAHAADVERMLAWGYWPRLDPRPSQRYLDARRAWGYTVRRAIDQGLADTPFQVQGLRPAEYAQWRAAADAEVLGETVPERVAPLVLPPLPAGRRTIVWAQHVGLQQAAAAALGCPLHRDGGRDANGVRLDETRESVVVASIEACHAGFNAQYNFDNNVVLEPPSDPEKLRQLIGRTARQGQRSPQVGVTLVVNCASAARSLRTALDRARAVLQDTGATNPILQLETIDW